MNVRDQIANASGCPQGLSFATNIASLFVEEDVDHMKSVTGGSLDLSSYQSVKIYASQIYSKVASGAMPPAPRPAWAPTMVNTFACWIQQGCQP